MSAVLTVGQPIVAVLPTAPEPLSEDMTCRWSVGGAELNVAVGLRRLGVPAQFCGHVGDDPLGSMVRSHLEREGVDGSTIVVDPARPTACYVREWLPDGRRRPTYLRRDAAGTATTDAEFGWGHEAPALVHVTGITPALGPSPRSAIAALVRRSRLSGVPVSVDPNHRPQLWSAAEAAPTLRLLASHADVLLMSDEDAEVLFPGLGPEDAIVAAFDLGCSTVVLKRGDRGAIGADGVDTIEIPVAPSGPVIDPVGAGDAFDAGFLAGRLHDLSLLDSLRLGAYCGARAVEAPGEHDNAPRLAELPADLVALLAPAGPAGSSGWRPAHRVTPPRRS